MLLAKLKRRRRPLGGQRGLEQEQLLELDALAQRADVVDDHGRELLGRAATRREGMALGEHHQGVQARLLDGRTKAAPGPDRWPGRLAIWEGPRTFCPLCSKLAGGKA
jgi:hypothetical protein